LSFHDFLLRYASHVACLHVLSACAGAQNPVSALYSNASSLPPLQCDHFVTFLVGFGCACKQGVHVSGNTSMSESG